MSYVAFLGATSPLVGNTGALVHSEIGQSFPATPAPAQYPSTDYDDHGWKTSNTELTAPDSLPAGTLMRLFSAIYYQADGYHIARHRKNGAGFAGQGSGSRPGSPASNQSGIFSAIVPVMAGEAFSTYHETASAVSTTKTANRNWMGVEIMPSSRRYTFATLSGSQSITSGDGDKALTWTHSIDTMGAHSNSGNLSRFTVPPDTTGKVRITATVSTSNSPSASTSNLALYKNGSFLAYLDVFTNDAGLNPAMRLVSPILDVVSGDYIEVRKNVSAGTHTQGAGDANWACFEELPSDHRYCLVTRSTSQSVPSNVATTVTFDVDTHDPEGCHDTSTQTGDVVVPSGVTRARCSFGFKATGFADALFFVSKNGGGNSTERSATSNVGCGFGCWFDAAQGDTIQLACYIWGGGTIDSSGDTENWFQVEFS